MGYSWDLPSGKLTLCYGKWTIEIEDLPMKHDEFPNCNMGNTWEHIYGGNNQSGGGSPKGGYPQSSSIIQVIRP